MCVPTCFWVLDEPCSCYIRVGKHQHCFNEAPEGFSGVGTSAVWHKVLIADFVSLRVGLDAISSMLGMQGGTGFIPGTI